MIKTFVKILKSIIKSMKNRFLIIYGFNIPSLLSNKKNSDTENSEPDVEIINVENLIDKLNDFQIKSEKDGDGTENPHEKELGEPILVQIFEEGGYVYEKSVWEVETGTVVKIRMISTPFDVDNYENLDKLLTLEQRLELAVQDERYEDAASIRDEINGLNKSTSGTTEMD